MRRGPPDVMMRRRWRKGDGVCGVVDRDQRPAAVTVQVRVDRQVRLDTHRGDMGAHVHVVLDARPPI